MEKYFDINLPGISIKAKLYANPKTEIEKVVICCHGFCGSKESAFHKHLAEKLLAKEKHAALLCFDWPCHGNDVRKKITLEICLTYLQAVVNYARDTLGTNQMYAVANSFGGYMTLLYLNRVGCPFEKIALRCPALPMHQVTTQSLLSSEDLEELQRGREVLAGFEKKISITADFLEELQKNDVTVLDYSDYMDTVMIIHGTRDSVVPPENTRRFAQENAMTWQPIEKADHQFKDPQLSLLAISRIIDFLRG